MKYLKIGLFTALFVLVGANFAPLASAQYYNYGRMPILSVIKQGGGDNVQISISNADPNSQITLYRRQTTTLWTTITNFGQADSNGSFTTNQSLGSDGSNNVVEQYVVVDGQQSASVQTYPNSNGCGYYNCGSCSYNCGTPVSSTTVYLYDDYFSPSTISVSAGTTVTWVNNGTDNHTVTANDGSFASITLNPGSSYTHTFYTSGTFNYHCNFHSNMTGSVIVTGSSSGNNGNVWFSPSSPTMYTGQSLAVSINSSSYAYGTNYGQNAYYVSSNSNSSVVSANISGTVLNLYASQVGSSNITVCQNNLGFCGSLTVTVYGGNGGSGSGNVWLSQSSISLTPGQVSNLTISSTNPNLGSYYVSSNSSSSVVYATISGSNLNLAGVNSGNANVSICQYGNNGCATVAVTVYSNGNNGSLSLSPSSVNLAPGQSATVYVYSSTGYNNGYYISNNSNSFIAQASVSGSQINVTAQNTGTTNLTVCQYGSGSACAQLSVSVNGNSNGSLSFSQNNININTGQTSYITVYGNGTYNISNNSNSYVASAILSGNQLSVTGQNSGTTSLNICQMYSSNICGTVIVNVSGYNNGNNGNNGSLYFTSTTLPTIVIGQYYNYQLQVTGGTYPYSFYLTSGQLPAGLTLSSTGQIYGTVQSSSYSNFSIRVNDNYSRTATASFTISGTSGGGVLGVSTYPNGQLINENGTVSIVYKNQKSSFASAAVFTGFGFKFSNVLNTGLTTVPSSGYVISTSRASHPWGTWIQSGSTIYFVHDQGLIPVPSWDLFINNRGQSSFIAPANIYDFQKPILSPMTGNDARLY